MNILFTSCAEIDQIAENVEDLRQRMQSANQMVKNYKVETFDEADIMSDMLQELNMMHASEDHSHEKDLPQQVLPTVSSLLLSCDHSLTCYVCLRRMSRTLKTFQHWVCRQFVPSYF